jgi:hypothetical protein
MKKTTSILFTLFLLLISSGCLSEAESTSLENEVMESQPPQMAAETVQSTPTTDVEREVKKSSLNNIQIDYASKLNEKYSTCLECHGDVKVFHTTEILYFIDTEKGVKPRLCIVCHGQKVHTVHLNVLDSQKIICETCHMQKGVFVVPQTGEDQLVVCEVCHAQGNYIEIHIEGSILKGAPIDENWITQRSGHQCDTCHIGEFGTIHFDPLSEWKEKIEESKAEALRRNFVPLNISYL